jgi:hypothetical protein
LISRGKPIKLFFPSIRFIKLGKVPSNEKRTLTDILLLIIRMLLLLALIIFFAAPEIQNNNLIKANKKCVVILDTSISSFHKNYLPSQINKIDSELKKLNEQKEFLVINSANQIISSTKTNSKEAVISFLKNLKSSHTSPNHRQALQEASDFIGNDKATLIIASLFDMAGFEQIKNISLESETEIICISAEVSKKNISILGAQFGKNTSENNLVRLTAKLQNESVADFNGEIKISFAGKTESKKLELKPTQIGTVVFNSDIAPGSPVLISVESENDEYSPDNSYYCKSPQAPIAEFLLIKPEKTKSSESIFIEEALNVTEINMTKINMNVVTTSKFNPIAMKAPNFIMLSGCADLLTNEQLNAIKEWHKQGTHLIITPSEEFRKCFSVLLGAGIITQTPSSKFGSANNSMPVFFNNLNEKSPYTNIFLKDGVNDFISIPIRQYIKMNHLKNTEILLTTENDDPILVINRLGSGICFLFSMALDPAWSDLPITTSFLPLTRQLINVSFQSANKKLEEYVPPATFVKTTKEDEAYLFNSAEFKIPLIERGKFLELQYPGVYQLAMQSYIVNDSRKHSRPDMISAFELKNSLLNKLNNNQKEENKNESNYSLKNYLIYLMLLLIFIEIFLHNEIGRRKKEVVI